MSFRKSIVGGITAGLFMAGSLPGLSQAGSVEDAIEYRQAVMNVFGWNMKPMGAMVKGKVPFDQKAFKRHAGDLANAASLDLLAGFPEDSDEGETDALAEIWIDFDDFTKKYQDLRKAADALKKASGGSDQKQIKAAFGDLGKACKSCHKAYKN
jgi:cytochrome c556